MYTERERERERERAKERCIYEPCPSSPTPSAAVTIYWTSCKRRPAQGQALHLAEDAAGVGG